MEVDHIFICVGTGAPEAEALKQFGLSEGSPNKHPGQGTANRRFFFHNAFIELLWLEDSSEAQSEVTRPTLLYERLSFNDRCTSPFGICFRPTRPGETKAPFPSWGYRPSYLPTDFSSIDVGDGAPLSEPMWFFLPLGSKPDSVPKETRQPLLHRAGFLQITAVRISLPNSSKLSAPAACAVQSRSIGLAEDVSNLLEIGFDNETQGSSHDFRPVLPLVFKW